MTGEIENDQDHALSLDEERIAEIDRALESEVQADPA